MLGVGIQWRHEIVQFVLASSLSPSKSDELNDLNMIK